MLDVLRREQAPATFFVIGLNARPEARARARIVDEGHEIGNHTFTHPDISAITWQQLRLEINATERLFESHDRAGGRCCSGRRMPKTSSPRRPSRWRRCCSRAIRATTRSGSASTPATGRTPASIASWRRRSISPDRGRPHRAAARQRAAIAADGRGAADAHPVAAAGRVRAGDRLVADGSRRATRSCRRCRPGNCGRCSRSTPAFLAIGSASAMLRTLFLVGIVLGIARLAIIGLLAVDAEGARAAPARRDDEAPRRRWRWSCRRTTRSASSSRRCARCSHRTGRPSRSSSWTTDRPTTTYEVVTRAFAGEPRVRALPQAERREVRRAQLRHAGTRAAPIVVALDADTVFHPDTVRLLAAAFRTRGWAPWPATRRSGNRVNLLTRWQALEYITSQNLDRRAFDLLELHHGRARRGRRVAASARARCRRVLDDTVAEDADLTMAILRRGYDVVYEERALAFTEAPDTVRGLLKQRFRWVFGTLQAAWKQRDALLRPRFGSLGLVALPNLLVFQVLFPLVCTRDGSADGAVARRPRSSSSTSTRPSSRPTSSPARCSSMRVFVAVDLVAALLAFVLERQEDWRLLLWLPLQRFAYRQLMYYVVVKSVTTALRGTTVAGASSNERRRSPAESALPLSTRRPACV